MRSYKMSSQLHNADHAYHDPLESFTDRETVITLFDESLQSAQPSQPRFLALKGNSGTGKTFLIAYMTKYLSSHYHWKSGCISVTHSDISDFRLLLAGVEDALKTCVSYENLKQYRIKRDDFQRRFDEYCSTVTIGRVEQVVSANGSAAISGVSMNFQVTTELHRREQQLRSELTRALIELAEENEHPLCLFIDRYELLVDTDTGLLGWLFGELLLPLIAASPQPIHIVTCGWEWPADTAIQPFTARNQLNDFSFEQVRGYLEKQNVLIQTSSAIQQELVSAFSLLTRGHPLVLGLAVIYFKQLDEQERAAERFLQHKSLINERARVEFLEERLLKRLPEPHRTLLERGPILRTFDLADLQVLLNLKISTESAQEHILDERTYSRFVNYPFVNQVIASDADNTKYFRYSFHELVRQVRLAALRRHYPRTKEALHQRMVEYYRHVNLLHVAKETDLAEQHAEKANKLFKIQVEMLYHALQVSEMRISAFEDWKRMTKHALAQWDRQQSGSLLELVRQLTEEDEPFLGKQETTYGFYRMLHAQFLRQESRWEEAKEELEQAMRLFEQREYTPGLARACHELGEFYISQGRLDEALPFYTRLLTLEEYSDGPTSRAATLNGIGVIYLEKGRLKEAQAYFEQMVALEGQESSPDMIAVAIHNIGSVYRVQGQFTMALHYFEQALVLREKIGNLVDIANSLNNIGGIYDVQSNLERALEYYERALQLREQIGNPIDIATSLNNIGLVYKAQDKFAQSLSVTIQHPS
jgi:tetratricopeptide (TPR) repeat protein